MKEEDGRFDHITVMNDQGIYHPTLYELNDILIDDPGAWIIIGDEANLASNWRKDPRLLPKVTLK